MTCEHDLVEGMHALHKKAAHVQRASCYVVQEEMAARSKHHVVGTLTHTLVNILSKAHIDACAQADN